MLSQVLTGAEREVMVAGGALLAVVAAKVGVAGTAARARLTAVRLLRAAAAS